MIFNWFLVSSYFLINRASMKGHFHYYRLKFYVVFLSSWSDPVPLRNPPSELVTDLDWSESIKIESVNYNLFILSPQKIDQNRLKRHT